MTHAEEQRERRVDVAEARAAVEATNRNLDRLVDMLRRHFRLGVAAVGSAFVVGVLLVVLAAQQSASDQRQVQTQREVQAQAIRNEVEVLRHRVNGREEHKRLCEVALGASRTPEQARAICEPVLGDDYETLKAELAATERRLERVRNGG